MRYLLPVFISLLALVTGCKKTDTTPQDLAKPVVGLYRMAEVTPAGSQTAITVANGSVLMVREGESLTTILFTLTYATVGTSGSSTFSETQKITLQPSGSAIALLSGSTQVGSWFNNTLTMKAYPFNNSTVSFTAAKQ
ncbi:hypothetical protein [Spirosoma spitsbergense]|jgi:hypothetical protein|uniref:hypothetical protein n=1 Tax=Spirosoma spitsbergense TaxID=431554 RepID=UPI000376E89D|nr:hypothetical protein [Spirosoma spitsbergense]